jgi:splicing factor 3A subunit 1
MAPPPMPMPMGMGMPPGMAPPPGPPPAPSGDEQEAKRQRVDEAPLVAEEDFAEANQGPVVVRVTLPEVDGDAQLRGQTIELELASVMETIGDVKARLASVVGVASSKQKMSTQGLGFLKDTSTLAVYNFGAGTEFLMGLKERGGRTKK